MTQPIQYLHIAGRLVALASSQVREDAIRSIELAIASLDIVLALPPASITLDTELRARLLMATILFEYTKDLHRAETILSRGLVRIGAQEAFIVQKLAFNELCVRILCELGSTNPAKNIIKDSLIICNIRGRSMNYWRFLFLLRSFEMEYSFASVRQIRSLANGSNNARMKKLCDILESVVCILQGLPLSDLIQPEPIELTTDKTSLLDILDYLHLGIAVVGDVLAGQVSTADSQSFETKWQHALAKLAVIGAGLDKNPRLETSFTIDIETESDSVETVCFQTLSTRRLLVFMYMLHGIVYLPDLTSSKSEKFLSACETQLVLETQSLVQPDNWTRTAMMNLHIFKTINYLLRMKLSQVDKEIQFMLQLDCNNEYLFYLQGCCAQLRGELDAALTHYLRVVDGELLPYCQLNTALIYRGNIKPDQTKASDIVAEHTAADLKGSLRDAYEIVKSISPGTPSLITKRILTTVLDSSRRRFDTQFSILISSILSARSGDPDEMKLKLSNFAMAQASRSVYGSELMNIWSYFNGQLSEQLNRKHESTQKADAAKELNQKMKQALKALPAVHETLASS